jgi:hypothetical protein
MFNVLIKGFDTEAEAKEFIAWFEGHGEQISAEWFQTKGMKSPFTNVQNGSLNKKENEDTVSMEVKML